MPPLVRNFSSWRGSRAEGADPSCPLAKGTLVRDPTPPPISGINVFTAMFATSFASTTCVDINDAGNAGTAGLPRRRIRVRAEGTSVSFFLLFRAPSAHLVATPAVRVLTLSVRRCRCCSHPFHSHTLARGKASGVRFAGIWGNRLGRARLVFTGRFPPVWLTQPR